MFRAVRMSLAASVRRGAAVRWWPLRLMVISWRGLRARMTRLMLNPGGLLEVSGDGQGGHNHGQVGLNSIALVVEHGSGSQVVLAHPEGLLDVPQLVVGGDDLTGAHQACGDER